MYIKVRRTEEITEDNCKAKFPFLEKVRRFDNLPFIFHEIISYDTVHVPESRSKCTGLKLLYNLYGLLPLEENQNEAHFFF